MIFYLMDAFYEAEKEQGKKFSFKDISTKKKKLFFALILSALFFTCSMVLIPINSNIYWLLLFSPIIFIVTFVFVVEGIKSEDQKEYERNIQGYLIRLDRMRKILNKEIFLFYSEAKIKKLIEDCNEIIPTLEYSQRIFKPLLIAFNVAIFPLIITAIDIIVRKISVDMAMQVLILIILIFIISVSLFYLMTPFVRDFLDNDYKKIKEIKAILSDILLTDFMK
jgi:hypothetical protein